MRRLAVAGVVVAALLAGACGGKDEPLGPTATVPQGTTTTNPYAVPAVIDEAYVNRVLAGLDQVIGDATRLAVSAKSIPPGTLERFQAVYANDGWLALKLSLLQDNRNSGFVDYVDNPGNQVSSVSELLSASEQCIFAGIDRDYTQVASAASDSHKHQWIAIRRLDIQTKPLNPTGWFLIYDGYEPGRLQPEDPCANP